MQIFDAAFDRVSGGVVPGTMAGDLTTEVAPAATAAPGRAAGTRRRRLTIAAAVAVDLAGILAGYSVAGASARVPLAALLTLPLWIGAFAAYGLYDRSRLVAPSEEARRVFHGVSVGAVIVLMATFLLGVDLGRSWLATLWFATLVTVGVTRFAFRKTVHALAGRGNLAQRVLVVGVNDEARTLARTLARRRWLGYQAAGFVDTGIGSFGSIDGLPVVGSVEAIADAIRETDASTVLIAGSAVGHGDLPELYTKLAGLDVEVRVSAGLPHIAASRVSVEPLDGVAVLAVRPYRLSFAQSTLKRAVDVAGALFLLLAAAPVMAAVAVAVRLTSSGPALFRQTRVGRDGREFTIFKFRTMVVDAEERKADLAAANEADGLLFKMAHDPRITKIGRPLRTLGLDELPQLLNVLKGDMSLVGPRPPIPSEAEQYDDVIKGRLSVKPGITGLWQVNGRHELSFADYIRYDLFYVNNWSLGLDLYVIARTLPALLARRGAA